MKCQKNTHHNLQEPKVMSSNCLICPTNNPKLKKYLIYYYTRQIKAAKLYI